MTRRPAHAAFLPSGYPTLGFLQFPLSLAIVARVLYRITLRRDEEHLQPNVYTRLLTSERHQLNWNAFTGQAAIPPISLFGDSDRLDSTLDGPTPPNGDSTDLGEYQIAIIEGGTVAKLLVGETRVAVSALEAGIPWQLTRLDAAKECLEGTVQAGEHVLQDLGVDVVVLGPNVFDGGKFSALMGTSDALVALLPSVSAFLENSIVEFPAATQNERHLLLLLGRWQKFVLEGLANGRLFHSPLFWPTGAKPASQGAIQPRF